VLREFPIATGLHRPARAVPPPSARAQEGQLKAPHPIFRCRRYVFSPELSNFVVQISPEFLHVGVLPMGGLTEARG
jgi:hypothetical protein